MRRHRANTRTMVVRFVGLATLVAAIATACGDDVADTRAETYGLPDLQQDLESEVWRLDGAASTPAIESDRTTMVVEGESIAGNGPCNTYRGAIEIDDDAVSVGSLAATMMACEEPAMAAEAGYLQALESVDRASFDGTQLTLSGDDVDLVFEPDGDE